MTVNNLINLVLSDVTNGLAKNNLCPVLSDRWLEPPYPAGFRIATVLHNCADKESGSYDLGVSLWRNTENIDESFYKQLSTTDPARDLPDAIRDLFRQFNEKCWTSADLLEAWKDMPCQNYCTPSDPIGIPYLHFNADDAWQAVFDWFSDQAEHHERPIIKKTLYLEKRFAQYYQWGMTNELDYAACGIDADSRVATYEISFGDLWTMEYRICAGEKDTPLYNEVALIFDGNPIHTETNLSNRTVLGKWEIDSFPGNFVRFVLEVREKPDAYTGYFQGKTLEGKWVSGYLRQYPGESLDEAAFCIQSVGINFGNRNVGTMVSEVMPDTIVPYIGLKDFNGTPIYGNSILRNPITGQHFTPFWLKKSCGWVLQRDSKDGGGFFSLDDPVFWVDTISDEFIRLEIIGNAFDGLLN